MYNLLVGTTGDAHLTCLQERVWYGAGSSSLVDEHEQVNLHPIEHISKKIKM